MSVGKFWARAALQTSARAAAAAIGERLISGTLLCGYRPVKYALAVAGVDTARAARLA